MTGPAAPDATEHRRRGDQTRRGALVLLAVLAGLSAVAIFHGGPGGAAPGEWPRAVGIVAMVCGASSLGGWFVARLGADDPALAVSGALGAIALRLVLPLCLLGWLSTDPAGLAPAGRLRNSGAGGLLVLFYLTLLASDILLHIMWGLKGRSVPCRRYPPAPSRRSPRSDHSPPST